MNERLSTFTKSARDLSRNPLGIIALFIVLIYGFGCVVVTFATDQLATLVWHPIIVFLSVFPFVVLATFAYLVAKHHRKLYAPKDYDSTSEFFWDESSVPASLADEGAGIAVSDGPTDEGPADLIETLKGRYKAIQETGFSLVHVSQVIRERTAPNSGRYRIRAWIEPLLHRSMSDIQSVTYHVWDDFPRPIITSSDRSSNFDVWLSVYGEFPIVAAIRFQDGTTAMLERYLELPGRPPD